MRLKDYLNDSKKQNGFPSTAKALRRNPYLICAAYLLLVTCAELLTIYYPDMGITSHVIILFLLLLHSALEYGRDKNLSRFLMALLIAPLIRILSLALPLAHFAWISWFMFTSIPIYIAIFTAVRLQGIRLKEIGLFMPELTLKHLSIEAGIILIAIPFGILEYQILKPEPLPGTGMANFIIAALIFIICTGFLEELTFRGLLQYNAIRLLSKWSGILFVSILFGVLHVGNISTWHLDCVLAFSVGFVFSIVREKTGSIYGISISHGIINIMLFLVMPAYF